MDCERVVYNGQLTKELLACNFLRPCDAAIQRARRARTYESEPRTPTRFPRGGQKLAGRLIRKVGEHRSVAKLLCGVLLIVSTTMHAAFAGDTTYGAISQSEFEKKYVKLTREILLLGLDFEQYSLNYRINALRDDRTKRVRYFLGQEASAAGAMTAAIIGTDQTYKVIHSPHRVNLRAIKNLNKLGEVTSIIGGASSGIELASNSWHAIKDKAQHRDSKTATKYLTKESETKLLDIMRDVVVNEHKNFEITKVGFRTSENVFYVLNIGTSVLSAVQYRYGYRAVRHPRCAGTSALASTISAGMVMANPVIASVSSRVAKRRARKFLDREFGVVAQPPSVDQLKDCVAELQRTSANTKDDPSCQITSAAILDAYGVVSQIFPRELESEIRLLHELDQVAVQNEVLAQPIGGAALASGVTSMTAYYKHRNKPRAAANSNYASAVSGLVGAGMATGLTAIGFAFETWNRHHLKAEGKLPEQLMEERITASKSVTARLMKLQDN
jgi:hypothetical protein